MLILIGVGVVANPLAKDPWSGQWSGDGLSLELEKDGDAYEGRATAQGMTFEIQAVEESGTLTGTFGNEDGEWPFNGTLSDGKLLFQTADTTYRLVKATREGEGGPKNPLAGGSDRAEPKPSSNGNAALSGGTAFRHPIGLSLRHPQNWKLTDTGDGVTMTPPNPASNEMGPTEAYLLTAKPDTDKIDPAGNAIRTTIEQELQQVFPFVKLAEKTKSRTVNGRTVARVTCQGKNPDGKEIVVHSWILTGNNFVFYLIALGESQEVAKRFDVLEQIVGTLTVEKMQRDPNLVGTFPPVMLPAEDPALEARPAVAWSRRAPGSRPTEPFRSSVTKASRPIGTPSMTANLSPWTRVENERSGRGRADRMLGRKGCEFDSESVCSSCSGSAVSRSPRSRHFSRPVMGMSRS
jgi:hypothetical protein